jgi:hypothetical protein
MADTSQRKPRRQSQGTTQIERNRRFASIPQGNEITGNVYNAIRGYSGLGINFQNTENFNQSDADYTNSAYTVYNEAEPLLKNLEGRLANSTYTVTFNSNTYTFTAKSATIGELVTSVAPEQEYQDKTVALSPTSLFNGFRTSFIAPATNTGSVTISIQLYDTTFTSKTLKKYENGVLVNLTAGDIVEKRLYDLAIISGDAVLFSNVVFPATNTTQGIVFIPKPVIMTYVNGTSASYSSGNFAFDDGSGQASISAGTLNISTNGLNGLDAGSIPVNGWLYTYQIYNPTTKIGGLIASISATIPTLPSGFTKYKRIKNGFLRISASNIQQFSHYENEWISTNQIVIANQTNVINFTSSSLPTVALKADLTSYFELTGSLGQSTQVVWGNLKPYTSGVDALFLATNNGFTAATNGYIYANDGVVRATNPVVSSGVSNSRITLKTISEL